MTNQLTRRPVLCFGEVLWDCLPRGLFLGGAPINVAYHLNQLGTRALPLTAVGRDFLGDEIVRRLKVWGLETEFVHVDTDKPTGVVRVELNAAGSPNYEIAENVAWDRIELSPDALSLAEQSAALIFGSLAQRSEHNRRQLTRLRERRGNGLQVFDVNLRPPFDAPDLIWSLARGADLIKLNDAELRRLLGRDVSLDWLELGARDFAQKSNCGLVCVTAGAKGAGLLKNGRWFWAEARPIQAKDTVGAGDAFLAALVHGLIERKLEPPDLLERACRIAEFVASRDGATPAYSVAPSGEIIVR